MPTPDTPDMYPGCTWADRPITDAGPQGIGTAATVEPGTGRTTRFTVHAYDPVAGTVTVSPDRTEDPTGKVRAAERAEPRLLELGEIDDLMLIHRRHRNDTTSLHPNRCRHAIKTAFTAGGDRNVPGPRRVYLMRMHTTEGRTFQFMVKAPSQKAASDVARTWWQGTRSPEGVTGGRLDTGEHIDVLTCLGARDMPAWDFPGPVAALPETSGSRTLEVAD